MKTQLQEKELAYLKTKQRVALKWATGCGKSKMAIDLINSVIQAKEGNTVSILFVVAERAHIQNWQEEMSKWNLNTNNVSIEIICYASLHKVQDHSYNIIVLDEVHHVFTEKRLECIRSIGAEYVYVLSATLSSNKLELLESIYGKFTVSSVTLKDAIKNDILSKPRVYIVEMELDNTKVSEEIKVGKGDDLPVVSWENRGKYIYANKACIIKCTEYQKYLYYTNTLNYWKERYMVSNNHFHHNKWVNAGSTRKKFLGDKKTKTVNKLLTSLPHRTRFVCFCASIAQAESFSGKYTISSRKTSKCNQYIINAFNAKAINQLYAVGMVTEGMNLNGIQLGIIVQLDGKERLFVQKFGRSMRSEDPVSIIFYYKGTQDEVYLRGALENVDNDYIKYVKADQLKTIKL